MSQITLEINNVKDEFFVLSLLQRLGVHYSVSKQTMPKIQDIDYHRSVIEKGAEMADFDDFLKEFEESRKDRELPFRNA